MSNTRSNHSSTTLNDFPTEIIWQFISLIPNLNLVGLRNLTLVNHFFMYLIQEIAIQDLLTQNKLDDAISKNQLPQFLNWAQFFKPILKKKYDDLKALFEKKHAQISESDPTKIVGFLYSTKSLALSGDDAGKIIAYALASENIQDLHPTLLTACMQKILDQASIKKGNHEFTKNENENLKITTNYDRFERQFNALVESIKKKSLLLSFSQRDNNHPLTQDNKYIKIPFYQVFLNFSGITLKGEVLDIHFPEGVLNHTQFDTVCFYNCSFSKNDLSNKNLSVSYRQRDQETAFDACNLSNTLLVPLNYGENRIPTLTLHNSFTAILKFKKGKTLKDQLEFLPHAQALTHRAVNTSVILQIHLIINSIKEKIVILKNKSDLTHSNSEINNIDLYYAKIDMLCQFIEHISTNLDQSISSLYECWLQTSCVYHFTPNLAIHLIQNGILNEDISHFDLLNKTFKISESINAMVISLSQAFHSLFNSSKKTDEHHKAQPISEEMQDLAFIIEKSSQYTNEPQSQYSNTTSTNMIYSSKPNSG